MTSVGNLKDTIIGIKCDRTTALGNPFEIRNEEERDRVCDGFERHLYLINQCFCSPVEAAKRVAEEMGLAISPEWIRPTGNEFAIALKEVDNSPDDAVFLCDCSPKRCHCDSYITYRLWWKEILWVGANGYDPSRPYPGGEK